MGTSETAEFTSDKNELHKNKTGRKQNKNELNIRTM